MSGYHKSAVVVARALSAEGYNDFVHNQVKLYWKHAIMDRHRSRQVQRNEKAFSKLVEELDLTDNEKKVLGRFISLRSQMNFDVGLRIGMMAFAHEQDKEIPLFNGD